MGKRSILNTAKLIVALTNLLVVSYASADAAVSHCQGGFSRDLSRFKGDLDAVVSENKSLSQSVLGKVRNAERDYELRLVSYGQYEKTDKHVFMIGGIHGDEPAGMNSILVFLKNINENLSRLRNVKPNNISLDIIPMANPSGWEKCSRLTANGVDINREFHQKKDGEIAVIKNFIRHRKYDLIIDRHEDPRDHVHSFYIVTYGNKDIDVIKNVVTGVKNKGFPIRRFSKTNGYLSYSVGFLSKLRQKTFTLFSRRKHISNNVYQIETPTEFSMKDRIKLQNWATLRLINEQLDGDG